MRPRKDFYTLCPSCEHRVNLNLAIKLQAARMGASCRCPACATEWICIQEWVFRDLPLEQHPVQEFQRQHSPIPAATQWSLGQATAGELPQQMAPPRPHLPTFQPPQHSNPVFASQMPAPRQAMPGNQPAIGQSSMAVPTSREQQERMHSIPKPHAWSWERSTNPQHARPTTGHGGYPQ